MAFKITQKSNFGLDVLSFYFIFALKQSGMKNLFHKSKNLDAKFDALPGDE